MKMVSLNGRVLAESDCLLPVTDKAVWYDFGVYESVKVLQGAVFFPELHVQRIFRSAELIDLNIGFTKEQVLQWISDFVQGQKLKDSLLRMAVYGDPDNNAQAKIYIFALGLTFYPDKFYSQGIKVITFPGERYLPQSKSFNLLLNFLALREAGRQNGLEAILIDSLGCATEGTRSNLFIIERDKIISPARECVLEGVTKILVEKMAGENDMAISEGKITNERLLQADEVFITSTSMNVMPVTAIDQTKIGETAGPVTRKLIKLFSRLQKGYA